MHSSSCGHKNTDGWNLDQGLAAQYAAQAGLDPDLAADAGEEVWDILKSLRDATGETDPKRQAKLVKRTKARLSKANLSRHGELVQHIEAKLLALQGRGGDTELAHLTPGEVIVPPQLQTPKVIQAIQQAAQNAGVDMTRYTAGSQASSVNPETGMAEYNRRCNSNDVECIADRRYAAPWVDVYYVGDVGQGNSDEYGTPGNPASDPPDGIEQVDSFQPIGRRPWQITDFQPTGVGPVQVADAGGQFQLPYWPHYGEPDQAPPKVPIVELPKDFGVFDDQDLIHRIRLLQTTIQTLGFSAFAPIVRGRRPLIGTAKKAFELQQIYNAHLNECGNRASCNPDAWRDLLPDND